MQNGDMIEWGDLLAKLGGNWFKLSFHSLLSIFTLFGPAGKYLIFTKSNSIILSFIVKEMLPLDFFIFTFISCFLN